MSKITQIIQDCALLSPHGDCFGCFLSQLLQSFMSGASRLFSKLVYFIVLCRVKK